MMWRGVRWATFAVLLVSLSQAGYLLVASLEARHLVGVGGGALVPGANAQAAYLSRQVEPSDTVAVTDAGMIGYRLPLETRVIDMVGLTDDHISHRPVHLPGGIFGRGDAYGKWDVDYVLKQRPRFIQVNLQGENAEGSWLTNFTGTTLLVNDLAFREAYRLVAEPGVSGIFVREEMR